MRVTGIDACRRGWVAVTLEASGAVGPLGAVPASVRVHGSLASLLATDPVAVVGIDMPLGLLESGWREADRAARGLLGPRRSSVFAIPPEAVWAEPSYQAANQRCRELTGQGFSIQAWGLRAKLLEANRYPRPAGIRGTSPTPWNWRSARWRVCRCPTASTPRPVASPVANCWPAQGSSSRLGLSAARPAPGDGHPGRGGPSPGAPGASPPARRSSSPTTCNSTARAARSRSATDLALPVTTASATAHLEAASAPGWMPARAVIRERAVMRAATATTWKIRPAWRNRYPRDPDLHVARILRMPGRSQPSQQFSRAWCAIRQRPWRISRPGGT